MANNPILTSDIYKNTGEIKTLISELEAVDAALEKLIKKEVLNAKKLTTSIKKSSAASAGQRQQIEETSKQADEITKRYDKYNASLNDNAKKIAALKNAQQQINAVNKLEAKLLASKEGSYNKLSAQYSINKIRLNQMSDAERNATKAGQELEENTKDIYEEMKRLQEATGKHTLSVGDYGKAFDGIGGPLGRAKEGLAGFSQGLKLLLANPIVAFIAAIVTALSFIFDAFKSSQEGADLFNEKLEEVSAIADVIRGRLAALGSAIIKVFKGDFVAAAEQAKGAFTGVREEIEGAIEAANNISKLKIEIEEGEINLINQIGILKRDIKELNKVAEDITKPLIVRENAAKRAIELSKQQLKAEEDILMLKRDLLENELDSTTDINKNREQERAIAEANNAIYSKSTEITELQTTLQNKLNTIRSESARNAAAAAKGQDEIAKQVEGNRIKALEDQEKSVNQLQDKIGLTSEVWEKVGASQKESVRDGFVEALNEAEAEIAPFVERLKAELQTATGDESLEIMSQLLGVDLALEDARQLVTDMQDVLGETPVSLPALKIEPLDVASLQSEGDGIADALQQMKDNIKEQLDEGDDDKPKDLYDLLGINLGEDADEKKQAISSTFEFVKKQITDLAAVRVEAAKEAVTAAERETQAAQSALDNEIANRNAGYANNVESAQKDLDLAKETQDAALAEQEKAQKKQQQLQTIMQTSNLITATSKILLQAGNPLLAIPLISLMWGTFIGAKVKAAQLTKKEYKDGGLEIIGGGSHASGNDTYLGFQSEGKAAYAERGEAHAIIPVAQTRKYSNILPSIVDSLRNGTFEDQFQSINNAVSDESDRYSIMQNYGSASDLSRLEGDVAGIRKNGERSITTGKDGRLIERYKNRVTVYRSK